MAAPSCFAEQRMGKRGRARRMWLWAGGVREQKNPRRGPGMYGSRRLLDVGQLVVMG